MTINLPNIPIAKSVWPKIFGGLGILSSVFAIGYYSDVKVMILGLPAYIFLTLAGQAFNSMGNFVSRQDNLSSELAGAANIPAPVKTPEQIAIEAQIEELKKKLEQKA